MRLDFNVLWIDDQPDGVKSQIDAIAKKMRTEGFEFRPKLYRSLGEMREALGDGVFTDEIDMVLVDWDLGGGMTGQEAIADIREAIRYKDVVFYSGYTEPGDLRKAAFDRGLEGVYCANRRDLVDEVEGVFESLVKKVLDLDHTRGIVLGATSDIDYVVNECLVLIHGRMDGTGQADILKSAVELVDERLAKLAAQRKELEGLTAIGSLFKAHMLFTAYDRLRVLSRILKADGVGPVGAREAVVTYLEEVVPKRNKYGHLVLVPDGRPTTISNEAGETVSLEDARELRKLILDLRGDFRSLLATLQSKG
jgi:DNA-binding NarL/FixJ family response regulator